ncbi:winged helix-turn-helix domain-containing protein (plasmid) [Halococcus dombrowskii]|uniref:Winged helix-turn-helix domain-containing protein n=1 Tax=Halococcus dombrowskii TaxID=179637 RepID=A0AAV3SEG3_HALDO|nr:winged helix-turn-helix domain-containing protein [Halococcus dombrowskii]UOO97208.1 winged helix-turn-helix domain-containing protein [Halococcus dombrowskii]
MSLLEAEVPITDVITTDPAKAKALENDVRAKILDMLADEEMTIEAINTELERRGEEKAETTVRHHVNVLKEAGMVELSRLEEAGGGTQKFYKSNTRVFSYELSESAETTLDDAGGTAREGMAELIEQLYAAHGEEIEAAASEMKPCEYCETQHYEEFIVRELVNRALTELSEDGDLDTLLSSSV